MKNIDELIRCYGVINFMMNNIPKTDPNRNKTIQILSESLKFIENCIKQGMSYFTDENAFEAIIKVREIANSMMEDIIEQHTKVAGEKSYLLKVRSRLKSSISYDPENSQPPLN